MQIEKFFKLKNCWNKFSFTWFMFAITESLRKQYNRNKLTRKSVKTINYFWKKTILYFSSANKTWLKSNLFAFQLHLKQINVSQIHYNVKQTTVKAIEIVGIKYNCIVHNANVFTKTMQF